MKLTDFGKKGFPKFTVKNPVVIFDDIHKCYDIEYDAAYEDGHIENHTGFGSSNLEEVKEYLKNYFELDDERIKICIGGKINGNKNQVS